MSEEKVLATVGSLVEALSDYKEINASNGCYVMDELLIVKEDLMKMGVDEGCTYTHMSIHVITGFELPKLHSTKVFVGASGTSYGVKIMEILGMEWLSEGSLVVHVLGQKVRTPKVSDKR